MNYSGLSINNDSTDNGRYLRARFVPNLEGTSPSGLFTTFASGQSLSDNRVTVARFKQLNIQKGPSTSFVKVGTTEKGNCIDIYDKLKWGKTYW